MSDDALAALLAELYRGTAHDDSPLARTVHEYAGDIAMRLSERGVVVLPPAVAEVLRTGELQMALYDLECATEELNRPQAEWRWDELRRVGIATERLRALRAALAVLRV